MSGRPEHWSDEDRARAQSEIDADYAAARRLDLPGATEPPDDPDVEAWLEYEAAMPSEVDIQFARERWRDTLELAASAEEFAEWQAWYDESIVQADVLPDDVALPDAQAPDPDMDMGD